MEYDQSSYFCRGPDEFCWGPAPPWAAPWAVYYRQFRQYLKVIYLGFEKSQRSVTYYLLSYINMFTYLLTYMP